MTIFRKLHEHRQGEKYPKSDLDKENLSTFMTDDPCMKQVPVHVLCIFSNTMLYITSHMYI